MASAWVARIWRLLAGSPERRGRRLARDAATIIANARATYRSELMRAIGEQTATLREETATARDPRERLSRLRALHREARSKHDQVALTALTLAIIDLEAGALDDHGEPARGTVASFVATPLEGIEV